MKKIALCSLLLCFGINYVALGEEAAQLHNLKVCLGKDGKPILCYEIKRSNVYNGGCEKLKLGDDCKLRGAKVAQCAKITDEKNEEVLSCEAVDCEDGFWLWYSKGNNMGVCHEKEWVKRQCIKGSDGCKTCKGVCVPKMLDGKPKAGDKDRAYQDCHCILNEEETEDDNTCPPTIEVKKDDITIDNDNSGSSGCVFKFNGKFKCKAKNSEEFIERTLTAEIDLTQDQLAEFGGQCPDLKQKEEAFNELYGIYKNALLKWADKCCDVKPTSFEKGWSFTKVSSGNGGGSYSATNYEVIEAQNRLKSFFDYADANRSVWRNAEGKFNTARLASDLTAGVVLGTVGGVVSGVVIKKKQVEKGFDALQCTVGGQKVADWGDQFTVGLQR